MKAILVINEMPSSCDKCEVRCGGYTAKEYTEKSIKRPLWCPLKPLPEKLPEIYYDSGWWGWNKTLDRVIENLIKFKDFAEGWNSCLDEILGEEDE